MEEAKSTLDVKAWENFRSLKFALNHVPIEMIAAIDDSVWRNHGFSNDGDFKALYGKIPEGTLKMIHGAWAMKSLEGLNGVYRWMESQINQGLICLAPDESPAAQDGSQDTQIHSRTADNPYREP